MTNIAKVLSYLIEQENHISDNELSRRIGTISQATITRIRNKQVKNPDRYTVKALATYFKITEAQMLGEEPLPGILHTTVIPRFNAHPHMSNGGLPPDYEEVMEYMRVDAEKLLKNLIRPPTNIKNLAVISAFGDSMRPTYRSGSVLIIDKGVQHISRDGAVYVYTYKNELLLTRLQLQGEDISVKF